MEQFLFKLISEEPKFDGDINVVLERMGDLSVFKVYRYDGVFKIIYKNRIHTHSHSEITLTKFIRDVIGSNPPNILTSNILAWYYEKDFREVMFKQLAIQQDMQKIDEKEEFDPNVWG